MTEAGKTVAIIAARGGSKGIPRKNLHLFAGKPLLYWSISQALESKGIHSVWITSDSAEILDYARSIGAKTVLRPQELSTDQASSESAWIHAIDFIESETGPVSKVVALQATSPVRGPNDLSSAIRTFENGKLDTLFSGSILEDFCIWEEKPSGGLDSLNFNYQDRKRRQDHTDTYWLENGSFYIFTPEGLRKHNNRLHGKIGTFPMPISRSFEIDSIEGLEFCEVLMNHYVLRRSR